MRRPWIGPSKAWLEEPAFPRATMRAETALPCLALTAARRQALEKGKYSSALISDFAHGEAAFRAGHHDLFLGHIGTDIGHYGWSLHDVFPMIKLRGAGVEHTGVSLRSNRRS
jgi:hypothetical protein